jgi:hypothetical protein
MATTSAAAPRSVLPMTGPALVVHDLEQEEVRQQQHEQGRVAVENSDRPLPHRAGR